jgi:hypothetical protein
MKTDIFGFVKDKFNRIATYMVMVNFAILLFNTIYMVEISLFNLLVILVFGLIFLLCLVWFDEAMVRKQELHHTTIRNPIIMEILDRIKKIEQNTQVKK